MFEQASIAKNLPMNMVAEYLEHALQFGRMAADEQNPKVKAEFEKQAVAYRKLAGERAKSLGIDDSKISN
jgi:hypothetical protein